MIGILSPAPFSWTRMCESWPMLCAFHVSCWRASNLTHIPSLRWFSPFSVYLRRDRVGSWLGAVPPGLPSKCHNYGEGILIRMQQLPAMAQLTLQGVQGHMWLSFSLVCMSNTYL